MKSKAEILEEFSLSSLPAVRDCIAPSQELVLVVVVHGGIKHPVNLGTGPSGER
jgi:hypothetical protein